MSDRAVVPVGYQRWLPEKPKVVVLCGSTRFMEAFHNAGWEETLKGNIVLSVGVVTTSSEAHVGEVLGPDTVEMLDELHWRKIDLADEVFVLNVDGYIGYSTRREIEYAESVEKPIRYLAGYRRHQMSELPSRGRVAALVEGEWLETRQPEVGRVLRAFAEGRLVDREAFDYEAAAEAISVSERVVRIAIAAAIGDTG